MQGKNTYAFYTQLPLEGLGAPTQSTVGQTIDSELGTGVMRSSLAEYVFHILYQSDDVEKAISSVLEIVGRHVGVSRVYILKIPRTEHTAITPLNGATTALCRR